MRSTVRDSVPRASFWNSGSSKCCSAFCAQHGERGDGVLQIVDHEGREPVECLELARLGERLREPGGHDDPGGLLAHRHEELEVLAGVGIAGALRSDQHQPHQLSAQRSGTAIPPAPSSEPGGVAARSSSTGTGA